MNTSASNPARQYPARSKASQSFQAPLAQQQQKTTPRKDVVGFWAHIRFTDATGQVHYLGQLGKSNGVGFNLKLFFSSTPINGSISLRASINGSETGNQKIDLSYIATYPRHPTPNMLNNEEPANFTDLVFLEQANDANFPPPPSTLEGHSKITHFLSWKTSGPLTQSWNTIVPPRFGASLDVLANLETFHLINRAKKIEAWVVGTRYLHNNVQDILQSKPYEWKPQPTSDWPGKRLEFTSLDPLTAQVTSDKPRNTFANDMEYEMVMKTAILRETETIVRQTKALLTSSHSLALVFLHPTKILPRNPEETRERATYYKAFVKLGSSDHGKNGDIQVKLDPGLKVTVAWPRSVCYNLGITLLPSGLPPTWSGVVGEVELESSHDADFILILKKPRQLAAPLAAEPTQRILPIHIHEAMIKAELNTTSSKRQFVAISKVANNRTSDIWPSLLNQHTVSLPFSSDSYNLEAIAEDHINGILAKALEEDQIQRRAAERLIKDRITEEEHNLLVMPAQTPVSATSAMLDGLTLANSPTPPSAGTSTPAAPVAPVPSEWEPDAPMPDAPAQSHLNFWGKSSKEMAKEEEDRVTAFTEKQEVWRLDALAQIQRGSILAQKFAATLNQRQLLAFNSSCRKNPGFTLLTGPPGTGKSHLIERIVAAYCAVGMTALVTAPSNYAVNVLTMGLFQGSKGEALSFHSKNSLGLRYDDIVRVYPEQEESQTAKHNKPDYESDEVLLHLMQAEAVNSAAATMSHLSLAGHIHRLAISTRGLPTARDPWIDYRMHLLGRRVKRPFRTCYKEIAKAVITRAKIVLATLNSSQVPVIKNNFHPCLVIVDEAAQACEPDSLIPFVNSFQDISCRFMAGDEKQLPPTVLGMGMSEQCDQLGLSLFSRLKATGTPTCALIEQFRMVPDISDLPNRVTYDGSLKNHASTELSRRPTARDFLEWTREVGAPCTNRIFYNVEQSSCNFDTATRSRYNSPHLAAIVHLLDRLMLGKRISFRPSQINVLCFYNAQRSRLIEYLRLRSINEKNPIWESVKVCTVDSYQGKEREIIILDLVVEGGNEVEKIGFLRKDARLNVALSRAREGLIVVGLASGITMLNKLKGNCLLLQLGKDVIEQRAMWNTTVSANDWARMLQCVELKQGTKRDFSELSCPTEKRLTRLDKWELEEFESGTYNDTRDGLNYDQQDSDMTGLDNWPEVGSEPELPNSKRAKNIAFSGSEQPPPPPPPPSTIYYPASPFSRGPFLCQPPPEDSGSGVPANRPIAAFSKLVSKSKAQEKAAPTGQKKPDLSLPPRPNFLPSSVPAKSPAGAWPAAAPRPAGISRLTAGNRWPSVATPRPAATNTKLAVATPRPAGESPDEPKRTRTKETFSSGSKQPPSAPSTPSKKN